MTRALPEVFAEAAARAPARPALVTRAQTLSYRALHTRTDALARHLHGRGITAGDRLLVALPIGVDLFATLGALWRLGAVAVFPEPALGLRGLRHAIRTTRPRGLLASGAYRALRLLPGLLGRPCIDPSRPGRGRAVSELPAPPDPDQAALISFTSGSTGVPKGICRTHRFMMAQLDALRPILDSGEVERDLVAFPVFTLMCLAQGRTAVLPDWSPRQTDRVTPDALQAWIRDSTATRALLPPALVEVLARTRDTGMLHTVFTGGGPVKPALVDALHEAHPHLRIVSVYGSTEAEPIAVLDWADVTDIDRARMEAGGGLLAGPPVGGVDVTLADDEILVAGPHVTTGYLDPAQDAQTKVRDGARIFHRTGDGGFFDPQGRLWLLGRHGGLIRTENGLRGPFSIEMRAEADPAIRRAALAPLDGETVLALELSGTERPAADAAALDVDRVVILDAIPMDQRHHSKVDMRALEARVRRKRAQAPGDARRARVP